MSNRRLYRSRDAMIGGVASGVAEFFGLDPTLVRLVWAFAILLGGSGLLAYIIAWVIIPPAPYGRMS